MKIKVASGGNDGKYKFRGAAVAPAPPVCSVGSFCCVVFVLCCVFYVCLFDCPWCVVRGGFVLFVDV